VQNLVAIVRRFGSTQLQVVCMRPLRTQVVAGRATAFASAWSCTQQAPIYRRWRHLSSCISLASAVTSAFSTYNTPHSHQAITSHYVFGIMRR